MSHDATHAFRSRKSVTDSELIEPKGLRFESEEWSAKRKSTQHQGPWDLLPVRTQTSNRLFRNKRYQWGPIGGVMARKAGANGTANGTGAGASNESPGSVAQGWFSFDL